MPTNTLITPNWVTTDTATGFLDSTKLFGRFDRQWDESYKDKPGGAQIGNTIQVRIEQRWTVTEGQALQQQAVLNQTVPISVNHQFNVGMGWSTSQATMEIEEVQSRYSRPAGKSMAAKWDRVAGAEVYKQVNFAVGTPGTTITSNGTWLDAVAILQEQAVPDEYYACVSPTQQAALLAGNFALFNPQNQIAEYFKSGKFASSALGVNEWYFDPLLPMHTTGSFTSSTPAILNGGQTGSSLTTDGWGTGSLKAGDIFTIDGVYATNPLQQDLSMGRLMQFTCSADITISTTATLVFTPAIVTSGPLQNVSAGPANDAAINVLGATSSTAGTLTATQTRQNLLFHPSAFAAVLLDLDRDLDGATTGYVSDPMTKIKMRWARQYNSQTDQKLSRVDTIGGIACILPYFAVRCYGAS